LKFTAIVVVWTAIASTGAMAFELCDDASKRREFYTQLQPWGKALGEKRYDDIDKKFNALLKALESGTESDAMVQRAFSVFQDSRPGNEPLHLEWIKRYPKSQAAHLAMGYYYTSRGYAARGTGFAGETSREQFAAMEENFRRALAELDAADALGKKPTLSAAKRIAIAPTSPALRTLHPTEIYRKAIKEYPDTIEVRIQYIVVSAPKWGGSRGQLRSIIDDAKPLPAADRRYIEYLVYQEMGTTYACTGNLTPECGQAKKAVEYYEKSIPLCPGLDRSLELLLEHHVRMKDHPAAVAVAARAIMRNPRNGEAYASRGWAYMHLGRPKDAFADYERGTQLDYGPAFDGLAYFYEVGQIVPTDYRKAIDLYMAAESHHVKGAKEKADKVRAVSGLK
jgi:tetratricopeptide (TPR) repeat protein